MNNSKQKYPSHWALQFFRWYCHPDFVEDLEGDLHERFDRKRLALGMRKAKWALVKDVFSLFRPGIIRPIRINHPFTNTVDMFRNHLKIAWRNLFKNKFFSSINIGGLAMGMLIPMLIGLWIHDELSYNTQYANKDRIAWLMQNQTINGKIETWYNQAMQLEPVLREDYGHLFAGIVTTPGTWTHPITFEDKKIAKSGSFFGPDIADMLSLEMVEGTKDALKDPNAILIAQSTATALFGEDSALDKGITVDNDWAATVKGVYQDLPLKSEFGELLFIASWDRYVEMRNLEERTSWGNSWFNMIVQIADNADMSEVETAIKNAKYDNIDPDFAQKTQPEIALHPMKNWYLRDKFEEGKSVGGRIEYVWLFGIIAVFVLFIACINFMNLSTARSEKRAKEVGIRKTLGSLRSQLINQFFSESLLISSLAFILALGLAYLLIPTFNELSGKELPLPWKNPIFWLLGLGFTFLTGLIAGSYPSFYLSAFQPVKVLKGTLRQGRLASLPRKVLVVTQFTVSISLIIGTLFVFRQIQFAKDRPIGYNKENLVRIPIKSGEIIKHYETIRTDLLNTGYIKEVAATDSPITSTGITNGGFDWPGKDPNTSNDFTSMRVTYEFGDMVEWELLEGRNFSKEFASDSTAFIINEAAVEYMGVEDPVGMVMRRGEATHKIVGVVKNLITQSPYAPVRQTLFMLDMERLRQLNLKLKADSPPKQALTAIEGIFKKYDPVNSFEYEFADEAYARKFNNEERVGKLASLFAILAILISSLGLFGLAAYMAEQRKKEIGIRKVLGASIYTLCEMLSRDFVKLVIISFVLATPITYLLMNNWLEEFSYRTTLAWWVFLLVGVVAVFIALSTVLLQALRAATTNPINVIKSE